ncbi:sugar transferase [Rathayibacter sp. YIM 133350]|uniref:sugar transferase n=1 Tax=Rathayibacter sp. YIM 133350 TaxID=3131992 RepID=UPI00307CD171
MSRAVTDARMLAPATTREPASWEVRYARRLAVSDAVVVFAAVIIAQVLGRATGAAVEPSLAASLLLSLGCGLVWLAALAANGSRSSRVVGTGSTEYRRLLQASFFLFGVMAIAAYLTNVDIARRYVLIGFPLGLVGLVLSRWFWRHWLQVQRRAGAYSSQVLLVGTPDSVARTAADLSRTPEAGYHVVGACTSSGEVAGYIEGTEIPISGNLDRLLDAVEASGADTVVITSANELSSDRVRELSWSLEPGRQHLIVAPSLTDIGGPRLHTRPVAGLPLIHVETPRYEGRKLYLKRAFDITVSATLIALLSPLLVIVAIVVARSSPGPVLFRQQRVGLRGEHFDMLKFRSMYQNAEEMLEQLRQQQRDAGNSVLFKMKDDPRVTPIGALLRRFSLDELPQLFNVLGGSMSLVGPRPPLEREVREYAEYVHRRFLVKPGITGLWQVSGRSNLSWDESVRLDLFYVENWTLTGDFNILWRTVRAVLASEGAY